MTTSSPTSEYARTLRAKLKDQRWQRIVAESHERATVFDAIVAHQADTGCSWRQAVADAAPSLPWPTFVHHKRNYQSRSGPTWERLLDGRVPHDPSHTEQVKLAACLLRQFDPDMSTQTAGDHLLRRFGDEGKVSETWLKRVWAEAGLNRPVGAPPGIKRKRKSATFHGGAGLAMLLAAEAEVGATAKLAVAAHAAAKLQATWQKPESVVDDATDRDDKGHFTPEYNARRREDVASGEADNRWSTDASKAARRDLSSLSTLVAKPETTAARMLAMGAVPLLTERRGFDGLDGPAGAWLGVLGATAYMPATLDKTLSELGQLQVDGAMWQAHAATWAAMSKRWRQPDESWPRSIVYVDGTADPYWTRAFAASGKVSRTGRVMPCLTRVAIHSGAGVPLLVNTYVGSASLKRELLPLLRKLDRAIGPDADVGRLTIVDSEVGTAGLIWAMHNNTKMTFVTVIKGNVRKGAKMTVVGPWMPYRKRDELREVDVVLHGKDAPEEGIQIRGVEMRRSGSRKPQTTLFVTNAALDDVDLAAVATWYLSRWPKQEQAFAIGRNGGGLNRSQGFGGEYVSNIALEGKQERAARSIELAAARETKAAAVQASLPDVLTQAKSPAWTEVTKTVEQASKARTKERERREQRQAKLATMPSEIYARDTGRDSIMTCLKLNVLSLVEHVLQEYFDGAKMTWRTYIEQFVALPVTVHVAGGRRVFRIVANPRQPERTAQLRAALVTINQRRLRSGKHLLVFELDEAPG